MGRNNEGRRTQIGVESTGGVAVAGNKLLPGLSFNLNVEKNIKSYRAQGYNVNTVNRLHRVWMTGNFEGPLSYEEIVYVLSSLLGAATITTPSGATNARQWLWTPPSKGSVAPKSFTVEDGDDVAALIISYVVARSAEFNFGDEEVTVSGGLIGRAPSSGALTSSPTELAQVVVGANELDVYMAGSGDLSNLFTSGNKITDAYTETFSIGEKFDPRFVHNTSYKSYKDLIEKAPELSMSFFTEHNAQSRTLFDAALSNTFRYIGIKAIGPEIESGQSYTFEVTAACDITPKERADEGGVFGYGYDCMPRHDATLGGAYKIRVVNTRTAL